MPDDAFVTRPPAPELAHLVDGYVGYRQSGLPPGVHRGLPSRHLTCIVSIGDPIRVLAQTDPRQPPGDYGFVLSGLQASPALVERPPTEEGVAIELTALGARSLLGLPAGELWSTTVEAERLLGRAAAELRERLHEHTTWSARFAVCDEVLGRIARDGRDETAPEVREAWRLLERTHGTMPVGGVAARVGWSRRHLGARFRTEFGLGPKLAARVMRFDRARWMLQHSRRPPLVDVAVACGYYDQAHLTRDFRELAGCPPGEWLVTEVVHDVAVDA